MRQACFVTWASMLGVQVDQLKLNIDSISLYCTVAIDILQPWAYEPSPPIAARHSDCEVLTAILKASHQKYRRTGVKIKDDRYFLLYIRDMIYFLNRI